VDTKSTQKFTGEFGRKACFPALSWYAYDGFDPTEGSKANQNAMSVFKGDSVANIKSAIWKPQSRHITFENGHRVLVRFTALGRVIARNEKVEDEVAIMESEPKRDVRFQR
jgi:hypothetical protein